MNKNTEVIANICLIFIGLICGIIFAIFNRNGISVIMFSIALASILYQFLGGIDGTNSLNLGVLKFGGSAAVLAGFIWFLPKYALPSEILASDINVSSNNWLPISSETGELKPVTFFNDIDTIKFPMPAKRVNPRLSHEYSVSDKDVTGFYLHLKKTPQDTIGYLDLDAFQNSGLYNLTLAEKTGDIESFTLYPSNKNKYASSEGGTNSTNGVIDLPFIIEANCCIFVIKSKDKPAIIHETGIINSRTTYLIKPDEKTAEQYIVVIEQARAISDGNGSPIMSKWLVKKLHHKLE